MLIYIMASNSIETFPETFTFLSLTKSFHFVNTLLLLLAKFITQKRVYSDSELDFYFFLDDERDFRKEGAGKLEKLNVSRKVRVNGINDNLSSLFRYFTISYLAVILLP